MAPPGNLSASTLVRLHPADPPAPSLALVAAVALADAVEAFGGRPQIKWPNDLLIEGAKLSGILLERVDEAVVIGLGVNLAHHPDAIDRPATSLAEVLGRAPEPDAFLEELAGRFAHWLAHWRSEGLATVLSRWLEKAHPIGTALRVRQPDDTRLDGVFDGLDATGALRLRLADGAVRVIHAADVFLMRD
jgi:BirA family biotin operon repressor/biotin-[acetyl-CoA-carboxylase] ligase